MGEEKAGVFIQQGPHFKIIAYRDEKGKAPAYEFLETLPEKDRFKVEKLFHLLCNKGKISNRDKFRMERDGIWVFKSYQIRVFCFFAKGKRVVLTHGTIKKKDKVRKQEIEKAKKIMNEYRQRGWRNEILA